MDDGGAYSTPRNPIPTIVHVSGYPDGARIVGALIPVGTYFLGKIGVCAGLFVRTYDGIVSLNQPENTWSCLSHTPVVEQYQPAGAVTITVS
jgi:hypothetical protein